MSMGIERQSAQYDVFDTPRWERDRQASYDESRVADMLRGPGIQAGLLDTRRHAWNGMEQDPAGDPRDLYGDGRDHEAEGREEQHYFDEEMGHADGPPEDPYAGTGPHPDFHDGSPHPFGTPTYNPRTPSFNAARHLAEDGGPAQEAFNPNIFAPGDKLNGKSQLLGDGERWVTALAVPPAQPAAPAEPVWLGHTFAPGHRVGMPWRDTTIPGTITHLEGQNVGVRWDDGQHSVEEPAGIRPLH